MITYPPGSEPPCTIGEGVYCGKEGVGKGTVGHGSINNGLLHIGCELPLQRNSYNLN